METTAVRRTMNNTALQNGRPSVFESEEILESDRGKQVSFQTKRSQHCIRCGALGHFWRQCPHPYRKELAFAGNNQNAMKSNLAPRSKELSKPIHHTLTDDRSASEFVENEMPMDQPDDMPEQVVAYTSPANGKAPEFCWVCSIYRAEMDTESNVCTSVVVDSGASASVCSMSFVKSTVPMLWSSRKESSKQFRFGDSRSFSSLGLLVIPGTMIVVTPVGKKRFGSPSRVARSKQKFQCW